MAQGGSHGAHNDIYCTITKLFAQTHDVTKDQTNAVWILRFSVLSDEKNPKPANSHVVSVGV